MRPTSPVPPPPVRCQPSRWTRGGHAQTVFGHLACGRSKDLSPGAGFSLESARMRDGDELVLYRSVGRRDTEVYLFHGLGGSTASGYVQFVARALAALGYGVTAVNHRGSGDPGRQTRPYQTGRTEDLEDLLSLDAERAPGRRRIAIGFSISGNTLLKLLALSDVLPDAAIAVNPPIELETTSLHLLRGAARIYDFKILQSCRRWIPHLRGPGPDPPRYRVPVLSSLREFDRLYIAPVSDFASRDDYYASASSAPLVDRIRTPTVVLSAADDPLLVPGQLERAPWSASTTLRIESHGGHLGYLSGDPTPLGGRLWLPYALAHYVNALAKGWRAGAAPPTGP